MKKLLCFLLFVWIAVVAAEQDRDWRLAGLVAGDIGQIVPDRAHPGVWFLVEQHRSSLYRSMDNGETWKYTGLSGVDKVMVHSASAEVFVVQSTPKYTRNLLSSTDSGRTFQLRSANAPRRVFDHPTDGKILWASGASDPYDLSVSFNRGADWQKFANLPYKVGKKYEIYGEMIEASGYYLSSVLVSPLDPNTVYVSTEVEFPIGCSGYYIEMELVSTNGGRSWSRTDYPTSNYIYDAAFPDRAFSVNYQETRTLTRGGWKAVAAQPFQSIVSVPGKPSELYGLYYGKQWISRNGGASWSRASLGPAGKARVLQARETPKGSFLAGTDGGGLYVLDDVRRYRQVTEGLREAKVSQVATAPRSGTVYVVTGDVDRFLFRTINGGRTWRNITDNLPKSPDENTASVLTVNQHNARHVIAKIGSKMAVSFDAGDTWAAIPLSSLDGAFFNSESSAVYFRRTYHRHIYKSTDGGLSLKELPATFGWGINDLAIDPYNGYLYLATLAGLYVSRDDGRTAELIKVNLGLNCSYCKAFYQIIALAQQGQYLALAEGWLYRSADQGVSWRKLSQARGRLHPADAGGQHLYLVDGDLHESKDGGRTWATISATVHPALVRSDYIRAMTDPRHRPLYLATTLGLFRKD